MKKLVLIDGNNLLFRSYYATAAMGNLMQNSKGLYTNGIYGFVNQIQSIMKMDFSHILVALDSKEKTHRHEVYTEYKGTRKEVPSELIMQFPFMKEYLDAAGIKWIEQPRYEADDIIGYCVKHFKTEFDEIVLISNDHDLLQLIDQNVKQVIAKKGAASAITYTPELMKETLGIFPHQMTDYKGLVGDTSDNIPGIPGVGDKTAIKLLEEYGNLETILEHTEDLKGKLKEKVEQYKEQAIFSKELATILQDFEVSFGISDLQYVTPDNDRIVDFFQEMEFHSFLKKMNYQVKPKTKEKYTVIEDINQISSILTSPMAIHLETFGLNYHKGEKIGFGLVGHHGAYYIPYDFIHASKPFQNWLRDETIIKYTYDLKQLKVVLLWDGLDIAGVHFDLLLAAYLLNPNITKEDFKVIVSSFDYQNVYYDEEIYGKNSKYEIPDSKIYIPHIIQKTQAIFDLREKILGLIEVNQQTELLNDIELPLSDTLAEMEYTGIKVNEDKLHEFGSELKAKLTYLEAEIYKYANREFNINSPKQLGEVLFDELKLPYQKKTKTGYSTDISVLSQLVDFSPIIQPIIEYRTVMKLYSTYYEGLKTALEVKTDSRIHTIYKQAFTQTGRLSSIEPNLQNIPIKTEEGRELRKVFEADENCLLYSCDYSQIELRVLAEMADVYRLKQAFRDQQDIHTATAKLIFKTDEITQTERRQAKAINFGIIYGKTAWGLSEDLHISPKQAERFIAAYFENYPEIKIFMDTQIKQAFDLGYVETICHRRRYIKEMESNSYQVREFGKRMAMNAPIQGSAADILKIAMVKIHAAFKKQGLKSKMLLQIHDEVVFSVDLEEKELVEDIIRENMENAISFSIPLTIDASFGANLFEVK